MWQDIRLQVDQAPICQSLCLKQKRVIPLDDHDDDDDDDLMMNLINNIQVKLQVVLEHGNQDDVGN